MAGLLERLLQRRQGRARLRQRGALRQHRGLVHAAQFELAREQIQLLFLVRHDLPRSLDLRAQRRLPDACRHEIGCQRQIGRLPLVLLVPDKRPQCLQFAPRAAKYIKRVRDIDRGIVETELRAQPRLADGRARDLLARRPQLHIHGGKQGPAHFGVVVFAGLPQGRLGGGQVGAVGQRLADQCIEWRTVEQRPPFAGDILHRDETLRCPGAPRHAGRGCRLPGQWLRCEVVAAWRLGRMVIRAHGARSQ